MRPTLDFDLPGAQSEKCEKWDEVPELYRTWEMNVAEVEISLDMHWTDLRSHRDC